MADEDDASGSSGDLTPEEEHEAEVLLDEFLEVAADHPEALSLRDFLDRCSNDRVRAEFQQLANMLQLVHTAAVTRDGEE